MDRLHGKDERLLERLLYAPGTGAGNLSVKCNRRVKTLDDLEWGQDILRQEALSVARLQPKPLLHKGPSRLDLQICYVPSIVTCLYISCRTI